MSGGIAVGVAATRALSTFVTGKILLLAFGPVAFSAHAQLVQIVAIAIPAGCGFLSLAISGALAAGHADALRRARRLGVALGVSCALLPLVAMAAWGPRHSAQWLFGDASWVTALWMLPAGLVAAIAVALYSALLVGAGRGRDAAIVDATMALTGIAVVAWSSWQRDLVWVMVSPVVILSCGALVAAWRWQAASRSRVQTQPTEESTRSTALRSYFLTGLAASAVGPAVMLGLRAEVMQDAGAVDVAGFVGAQRLSALVTAPVPVYIYMFLTSFFAASSSAEGAKRVRFLQWRVAAVLAATFTGLGFMLPFVIPVVFAAGFEVPLGVFVLVCVGEGLRAVAAIQAQYLATIGRWRQYLLADAVYFAMLIGLFMISKPQAQSLALAYAAAACAYLVTLNILHRLTTWRAFK